MDSKTRSAWLRHLVPLAAAPGESLLQETTCDFVADKVNAEPLESIGVRGREQPVQVYRFAGLK
ncbi:MAG: hypothetical protein C4583_00235 [Anaerolineaceae bacterium]|nr:MAG: hypothetical protein C4583_00235 [Anaerolineaceae bacterium]